MMFKAFRLRRSLKILRKELTNKRGLLYKGVMQASKIILKNSATRYKKRFPQSKRGPDVYNAILSGNISVTIGKDVEVYIIDEDTMDRLTKLQPTKVSGKVYHLWRLLSAGWGAAGSGEHSRGHIGRNRDSRYPSAVIVQRPIEGYRMGINPPYPQLLTADDSKVYIIRHPGFKGREWFLRNGNFFVKDAKVLAKVLRITLDKILKKAGLQ